VDGGAEDEDKASKGGSGEVIGAREGIVTEEGARGKGNKDEDTGREVEGGEEEREDAARAAAAAALEEKRA